MKIIKKAIIYFGFTITLLSIHMHSNGQKSALDYVDPTIGGVGVILQPTRPTVHIPNSMIRVYPVKFDQLDDQIDYFPLTNASHRLYSVIGLLPVSGEVDAEIWNRSLEYDNETTTPYYYSTEFSLSGDSIEFTPQERSGFFKVHFKNTVPHFLRLSLLNAGGKIDASDGHVITAVEQFAGVKAYVYAEVDKEVQDVITVEGNKSGNVLLSFGNKPSEVSFRYGISFISIEQAKENLSKEIGTKDFSTIKENAKNIWTEKLSGIKVSGGTEAQKRVFYTALYRSYERMVDINEYGQYYSAYDGQVHKSDEPFYVDNWIWDNYIALEPLHMILNPEMATGRIKSYIKMHEQGGTIPSFALLTGDWPAMTGNFAAVWMTDAWNKGLQDFDLKTAYEGLKKNSLDATLLPWRNGKKSILDDFYNENGYIPGLAPGEEETVPEVSVPWERRQAVSVTIETSYCDWSIAQLSKVLGYEKDKQLFQQRANNYKNVFRADKGFMWPKDKSGQWIEPYDPRYADRAYFTENNAYTYNWNAKHDLEGLFELMGGKESAGKILDQLFREELGTAKFKFWHSQPDASGLVGQFVMGNEPSFHIPYIYNYLGTPWKTQKRIRMLINTFYTDNLFGIPGDEDGGGMSSFVVFSMMGFFQVTPGVPVYSIGSPFFEESVITLENGKTFTIIANNVSDINKYIQSATLNGEKLDTPWISHQDIVSGAKLVFEMGPRANKEWGISEAGLNSK